RSGPFHSRTDRSEFTATTRWPKERAASRYRRWPTCRRSKQPFVRTTALPASRHAARRRMASSRLTTPNRSSDLPWSPRRNLIAPVRPAQAGRLGAAGTSGRLSGCAFLPFRVVLWYNAIAEEYLRGDSPTAVGIGFPAVEGGRATPSDGGRGDRSRG